MSIVDIPLYTRETERERLRLAGPPPESITTNRIASCFPQVSEYVYCIVEVRFYKQFFLVLL